MIFIVGWRGEPGVHDEPQHIYQGEVTLKLLEDMGIKAFVIGRDTTEEEAAAAMEDFRGLLAQGRDVAFVVRKGALTCDGKTAYANDYAMSREEIIRHIVAASGEDPIVSTTGKASRELFEIREAQRPGPSVRFSHGRFDGAQFLHRAGSRCPQARREDLVCGRGRRGADAYGSHGRFRGPPPRQYGSCDHQQRGP